MMLFFKDIYKTHNIQHLMNELHTTLEELQMGSKKLGKESFNTDYKVFWWLKFAPTLRRFHDRTNTWDRTVASLSLSSEYLPTPFGF